MTLSFKGAFHDIFSCLTCRIGSGKQVASVIVDDGKDQDDEDDTFVVEDAHVIQNDVDLVSSNAMKKHLPINPPLRGCSLFCFLSTETKLVSFLLTPWVLDMQLCTFFAECLARGHFERKKAYLGAKQ